MAQQLEQSQTCATDETIVTAETSAATITMVNNDNDEKDNDWSRPLFGSGFGAVDKETGLPFVDALNRELEKCIVSMDSKTVLAVLDINNLANINDKFTYSGADIKIAQIGTIIRKYCEENSYRMKGFKVNEKGKSDVFAVLIRYKRNIENCRRFIETLMTQIKDLANETVCVGMAKFNYYETKFEEWKLRAFKCLEYAKDEMRDNSENGKASKNNLYFDVNQVFVKKEETKVDADEKEKERDEAESEDAIYKELGTKEDFLSKMKEMAVKEDDKWFACIMDLDNFGNLMFENNYKEEIAKMAKKEVVNEVITLFKVLGGFNKYYFAYKLTDGDEFGLIICNRNDEVLVVNGHELLLHLRNNIEQNCKVTVSIGYAKINLEMEQSVNEWYKEIAKCLSLAKQSGKNQCLNDKQRAKIQMQAEKEKISKKNAKNDNSDPENGNENEILIAKQMDDEITQQSLKAIEVNNIYDCVCFNLFLVHFSLFCVFDPNIHARHLCFVNLFNFFGGSFGLG